MPEQLSVEGKYLHSVQLCVPLRMTLRVGVEVEFEDVDVLEEPCTMIELFGWRSVDDIAVRGRSDAGGGRVVGCQRMSEFVRGRKLVGR